MYAFWFTALVLVWFYYARIGRFYYGWLRTPFWNVQNKNPRISLSVVIAVRNEETYLPFLLNDLVNQDYQQKFFEVIIVDDHSFDHTPGIIHEFINKYRNIRYLRLSGNDEGKKAALHHGIMASRHQYILTTDADCRLSSDWIKNMADCFEEIRSDMIVGPVLMQGGKSFFSKFQMLEFLSLQGSTAGAIKDGNPVMCNSANLGFRKEAYVEVTGDINYKISSGDDVFLLHALHNLGNKKIFFIKNRNSVVSTPVQTDVFGFISQRRRWASKSRHYKSKTSIYTALVVLLINFYTVICLLGGLTDARLFLIAIFIFFSKSVIDFIFLNSVARFFNQEKLMIFFPFMQVVYFFYISFIAIASVTGNFDWKGRVVKY